MSQLAIKNVTNRHAGDYKCQPASSKSAKITVHVLNGTDQLAVSDHGKETCLIDQIKYYEYIVAYRTITDAYKIR